MAVESLRDLARSGVSAFGAFTENATAPSTPAIGDRWLDTDTGIEYTWISPGVWVDLGTSGLDFDAFVQTTGAQTVGGVKTFTDSPVVPTPTTDMQASTKLYADGKAFPSGTVMLFIQTSAPTGWTKSTAHDNKALRIVSGTVGSGGTVAFTTAFASKSVSGTVGGTALTTAQIPAHAHTTVVDRRNGGTGNSGGNTVPTDNGTFVVSQNYPSNNTGGGGSHDHSFTGTAIDLAVQYVDAIIATKD